MRANSDGRTVHLYVITDHPTNPLDHTDVDWLSWYDVAERVQALDPNTDSVPMLQGMIENENYETFSGFEPFEQTREWFARHDEHVVELAFELHRQLPGIDLYTRYDNNVPHHSTTNTLPVAERNRSISLNQSVHIIPFHPQDHPEHVDAKYHPVLLIPAISNDLFVAHHVHAVSDDGDAFVRANHDQLADIIAKNEMTLRTSWNRLNHPDHDMHEYTDPDDVPDILRNKHGTEYWKRLYFGWEIDTDQDANMIIEETVDKLTDLDRLFHDPADGFDEIPV